RDSRSSAVRSTLVSTRLTLSCNASALTGFCRKSAAPSRIARTARGSAVLPVTKMTGVSERSCRRRSNDASPSMPGKIHVNQQATEAVTSGIGEERLAGRKDGDLVSLGCKGAAQRVLYSHLVFDDGDIGLGYWLGSEGRRYPGMHHALPTGPGQADRRVN